MLPVAILAGGTATRLQPITRTIPKSLVAVAGKPFVERQLAWLAREGVERVVLCVGHLGGQIEACVGDGARFGLHADYSYDGAALLGTGGALRRALPLLGEAFFVLYGDSYLACRFAEVEAAFRRAGKPALMTVYLNDGRWDASNVLYRDGAIVRVDKIDRSPDMRHIDYGLGILSAAALPAVPAGQARDLSLDYGALAARGELAAFEVTERFYEIGSMRGLADAEAMFRARDSQG